jgi:UrcA family protein
MSKAFLGSMLFASIGATLALAGPATARTMEPATHEVRYGDLNLASEDGLAQLHRRINAAARRVCGSADPRDLNMVQATNDCRKAALADAAPKIELAVANARSGQNYAANAAVEVGKPVTR